MVAKNKKTVKKIMAQVNICSHIKKGFFNPPKNK